jgi:pilus assembly protein CpaB
MVEVRSLPKIDLPPTVATDRSRVIGKIARADLHAGQPILLDNLASSDRLSALVPVGMRAVTVALDTVPGLADLLKAGDRVDVVATFDINGGALTKTVLQDVQLLAAGSRTMGKSERASATLAVGPREAERLILAESKGKIHLMLRRSDDISYIKTNGVSSHSLVGKQAPVAPAKKPEPTTINIVPLQGTPGLMVPERSVPQPGIQPLPLPAPVVPVRAETGNKIEIIRGNEISEAVVAR